MRKRRPRPGSAAVPLASGLVVLAACGGPGVGEADVGGPQVRDDGVEVAQYEPAGRGGTSALLEGVVEVHDGCLLVRPDHGDDLVLPVLARDDEQVGTPSEGEPVDLGGGHVPPSPDCSVPEGCPQVEEVFVVAQPER